MNKTRKNPTHEILNLALVLPVRLRARLAKQLLLSLEDGKADEDCDTAWLEEIQKRLAVVEGKRGSVVDWKDGLERVRSSLAERRTR